MLPTQNGVGPSVISLPYGTASDWPTILDFLVHRFPAVASSTWLQRASAGQISDEFGNLVTPSSRFQAQLRVYYYRDVVAEKPIPFHETLLHQDEHVIVVDKPHFLPVTPSGNYLQETVLVRLKRRLGLDDLVPIHRIDRDTAGLVLFSVQPASRGAYQALFRERAVKKIYHAVAAFHPDKALPLSRLSRIEAAAGFMTQREVEGTPNALTHFRLLESKDGLAKYELSPVTGKRHQLRVHMNALGLPILGDGIYPELTPEGQADYTKPLQLVAKLLVWRDPITRLERRFESAYALKLP
jgi:tRNA pseudouridine32 synthase / 23S rRNA pseudouridine746 synthase